jgi:hypothetical protein
MELIKYMLFRTTNVVYSNYVVIDGESLGNNYHASYRMTNITLAARAIEAIILGTKACVDALLCLLVLPNFCRFDALWPLEVANTDGSTVAVCMVFVRAVVGKV